MIDFVAFGKDAQLILAIAGLAALVLGFVRWSSLPARRMEQWYRAQFGDKKVSFVDTVEAMAKDVTEIKAEQKARAIVVDQRSELQDQRHHDNLKHFDAIYGRLGHIEDQQEYGAAVLGEALKFAPLDQQEAVQKFLEEHKPPRKDRGTP